METMEFNGIVPLTSIPFVVIDLLATFWPPIGCVIKYRLIFFTFVQLSLFPSDLEKHQNNCSVLSSHIAWCPSWDYFPYEIINLRQKQRHVSDADYVVKSQSC